MGCVGCYAAVVVFIFFFFQAEDGIRDWSVTGVQTCALPIWLAFVPVTDAKANLIPLPQRADPNAVLSLDLKLAARANNPRRVSIATPTVEAPVMLAEWALERDTGQGLVYRRGSLLPATGVEVLSGFAGL